MQLNEAFQFYQHIINANYSMKDANARYFGD